MAPAQGYRTARCCSLLAAQQWRLRAVKLAL